MHEKARPPGNATDFWPQAEHNALLDALPRTQCCTDHQESQPDEARAEHGADGRGTTSPLVAFDTPGNPGELLDAAVTPAVDFHNDPSTPDTLQLPCGTNVNSIDAWPSVTDLGWLDDPPITHDDNASIEGIFSELCGRSPWLKDPGLDAQDASNEATLAIAAPKPPKLLYTPVAMDSMLMEYWFSDVCPMWSAFDSPSNPHRQLASSAWQQSEAVYYALQSMSAACLVDSLPHLKKYITVLSSQAVEAIQSGVGTHNQLGSNSKFPRELLLAIIAMGTSVCWSDTKQLGMWFLFKAHELLDKYDDRSVQLDEYGRQELEYFREALVYWEMLYMVLGSDPRGQLKRRKKVYMRRLLYAMSLDEHSAWPRRRDSSNDFLDELRPRQSKALTLHPWTGISTDVQHTFGLVILLCRDHRLAAKQPEKRTTAALSDALCDIRMARDLAHELKEANMYSGDHLSSSTKWSKGTGDSITPIRHLVDTAEAYRLAALLLLCQTFPDLEIGDLGLDVTDATTDTSQHHAARLDQSRAALSLAMQLIETLKRVPAESGTRCIQPILYIAAGSGMRFMTVEGESTISLRGTDHFKEPSQSQHRGSFNQAPQMTVALLSATAQPAVNDFKTASITQCTLEISRGRRFVIDRLCALQRSLPPRPIGVALDLVKAIWGEYDYGKSDMHWIDVMVDKGLQTLFG